MSDLARAAEKVAPGLLDDLPKDVLALNRVITFMRGNKPADDSLPDLNATNVVPGQVLSDDEKLSLQQQVESVRTVVRRWRLRADARKLGSDDRGGQHVPAAG